jgi:erythromycin esterase-like protein
MSNRALITHLIDRAVPLDLDVRVDRPDALAPFAVLDELVDASRVAFIVEMDHFIHEKYAYRLALIRYLRSRGYTWFGEELGWTDGVRIDRYLTTGDESHLDRVATYGYEGHARADGRDDSPTGILAESTSAHPEAAFRHEQREFARAVRKEAQTPGPPLRWFGFDVDYDPGVGYEELRDRGVVLERPAGESLADESARIASTLESSAASLAADARHALVVMAGSFEYVAMAHPAESYDALAPAMARRERVMHANVDHVLDTVAAGEKVALIAGSLHLMKDDARVHAPEVGAGPGGGEIPSVGHHIATDRAEKTVAFWMLHGAGESANPYLPTERKLRAARGTLDHALAKGWSTPALVPVSVPDPPPSIPVDVTQMHNHVVACDLAAQVDAVVFVPVVSPLRAEAVAQTDSAGTSK